MRKVNTIVIPPPPPPPACRGGGYPMRKVNTIVIACFVGAVSQTGAVVGGKKEPLTLKGHAHPVLSLAVSPDGKRLFSAEGESGEIKAWDLETGKELLTLRGHEARVNCLALS